MNATACRLGLGVLLLGAGVAGAQPKRVEQGIADAGPMSASLRVAPVDLRSPIGFEAVYRLSEVDVFGRETVSYMRKHGAITAVFPHSVYVPTEAGLVPQIPAGTVFRIGEPAWRPAEPVTSPPTRWNSAIDLSPGARPELAPDRPAEALPGYRHTIWNDEIYRRARMEQLVRRAAGG